MGKRRFIMGTNIVILEGNLGADVTLRNTNTNNVPVANFRMATNKTWNNAQGQKVEKAEWHNIVVWDKQATVCAQYLHKGSRVLVEGEIQYEEYEGPVVVNGQQLQYQNGQPIMEKKYKTVIRARRVTFLDKRPETQAYGQAGTVVNAAANPQAPAVVFAPPAGTTAPQTVAAPAAGAPVAPQAAPAGNVAPIVVPGV
jgi:single-strand DNA-binding protein